VAAHSRMRRLQSNSRITRRGGPAWPPAYPSTCGRTRIDLIRIANEVEARCKNVRKNIRVAVMGCAVNGPGEAREADIGIAGGDGSAVIFKKGRVLRAVSEENAVGELMKEIEEYKEALQ